MDDPLQHLPHAEPFRFITRVLSLTPGESGQALWCLSGQEDFFRGHFPANPIVPGVLISEALAQLSGIVGLHASASGRLVHVDMRFDASAVPPLDIALRSRLLRTMGPLRMFEVSAHAGDTRLARGTLTLAEAAS